MPFAGGPAGADHAPPPLDDDQFVNIHLRIGDDQFLLQTAIERDAIKRAPAVQIIEAINTIQRRIDDGREEARPPACIDLIFGQRLPISIVFRAIAVGSGPIDWLKAM